MINSSKPNFDYALLLLVAMIWSSSFGLIKLAVAYVGPATLTAGRTSIAAILLLAWLYFVKRLSLRFDWQALRHYTVVGVFGNIVPFTLIGWGELTIHSSTAAVLMGVMPIFATILAHWLLDDETVTRTTVFGVGFGMAGLIVLTGSTALAGLSDNVIAQLAVLVGALCYGGVTIYVRRYVRMRPLVVSTGATLVAATGSTLLAFLLESPTTADWSMGAFIPIVLLGIFPTAIATLLYFHLINRLGATTFSQVNFLIPLLGSLIGIVFMGEPAHWRIGVALVLISLGIMLVRRRA